MKRYRVVIDQTVQAVFSMDGESAESVRLRVRDGDWGVDDPSAEGYNGLIEDVIKWRLREVRQVAKAER